MALVLVQNERTEGGDYDHWEEVKGKLYRFPDQYKNRMRNHDRFIYYKGSRRADGTTATPEYFGVGRLGEVWRDERVPEDRHKQTWRWFYRIEDYREFPEPVPLKIDGEYIEDIPQNHWQVAVREISEDTFDRIFDLAGVDYPGTDEAEPDEPIGPDLDETEVEEATDNQPVLLPQPREEDDRVFTGKPGSPGEPRRSRYSNEIGRRAEKIVYRRLQDRYEEVRWLADEGEKPGWDIQYQDGEDTVRVEVKGSTGEAFTSIELTAREWEAAQEHGDQYWLYLVGNCFGDTVRRNRYLIDLPEKDGAVELPSAQ